MVLLEDTRDCCPEIQPVFTSMQDIDLEDMDFDDSDPEQTEIFSHIVGIIAGELIIDDVHFQSFPFQISDNVIAGIHIQHYQAPGSQFPTLQNPNTAPQPFSETASISDKTVADTHIPLNATSSGILFPTLQNSEDAIQLFPEISSIAHKSIVNPDTEQIQNLQNHDIVGKPLHQETVSLPVNTVINPKIQYPSNPSLTFHNHDISADVSQQETSSISSPISAQPQTEQSAITVIQVLYFQNQDAAADVSQSDAVSEPINIETDQHPKNTVIDDNQLQTIQHYNTGIESAQDAASISTNVITDFNVQQNLENAKE